MSSNPNGHEEFVEAFVDLLPKTSEKIEIGPIPFWNNLAVNAKRATVAMRVPDYVVEHLRSLGLAGLRTLAAWRKLDTKVTKGQLVAALADDLAANHADAACIAMILLSLFMQERRPDAIETISRAILPNEQFLLVYQANLDVKSRRLFYGLLVFFQDYRLLRYLLLYESGERAGYVRCTLTPLAERNKQPLPDDVVQRAEAKIKEGADLSLLDRDRINGVLEDYETRHGRHNSRCFDVFMDETGKVKLIFILRYLREASIREVDGVVFGDQAELIVLRMKTQGRTLEEHGISKAGREIATAIAANLLEEPNLRYLEDTRLTDPEDFDRLMQVLASGKLDDRLRLLELYLTTSRILQAPKLILRSDVDKDLSRPIHYLRRKGIDLLHDYADLRNIKLTFETDPESRQKKVYIFKVFCNLTSSGSFHLPYSAPNIPTRVRTDFELYLLDHYDVKVIPGTGSGFQTTKSSDRKKRAQAGLFPQLNKDWVARLMRGDIQIESGDPASTIIEDLLELNLITVKEEQFVRCAYPGDDDYPEVDSQERLCPGQITLTPETIDSGECPICGRIVEIGSIFKTHFTLYEVGPNMEGIKAYAGRALYLLNIIQPPEFPDGPYLEARLRDGNALKVEFVSAIERPQFDRLYIVISSLTDANMSTGYALNLSDFVANQADEVKRLCLEAITPLVVADRPDPLKTMLVDHFKIKELEELSFDMGIDFEDLPGETITGKAMALIEHCQHQNRLGELIANVQRKRPRLDLSGLMGG